MTLIEALQRKHRFTTTEEMLADYVLAHPNEVVAMSASQLAKAAHTSNSAIVRFCSKLGIDGYRSFNVTLARELSVAEVRELADVAEAFGMEVEAFGHGALCVCYSGQCLMSSMIGGRSANRGLCAQACRLPYELHRADRERALPAPGEHLLSPKDLCTIEFMDKIIGAGVKVFKIEGRARSAEYVKRTAQCYREAADAVCEGAYTPEKAAELKARLSEVFNRGFWDGYYQGAYLGQWSDVYGSQATRRKVYAGKVTNWFDRIFVAEVTVESVPIKAGADLMAIGSTTGVVEFKAEDIRVEFEPVGEAPKGCRCSIGLPEGSKLRRGDKVYIWEEVERIMQ